MYDTTLNITYAQKDNMKNECHQIKYCMCFENICKLLFIEMLDTFKYSYTPNCLNTKS